MSASMRPVADSGRVASLWIYPIKSLDGLEVNAVRFTQSGSLVNDRRFCLMDAEGRLINGKRTPAIHRIRSHFDLEKMQVSIRTESDPRWTTFNLEAGNRFLEEYLGQQLSHTVHVREDVGRGFLDDPDDASVTLVSQSSLKRVAGWFGWEDETQALRRFRPNLVIDGVAAFAEDGLAVHPDGGRDFRLGDVVFKAHRLCTRCVVPTRHPTSGETTRHFQQEFIKRRLGESLGSQIDESYGHAYLLSVCCAPVGDFNHEQVRVGDEFVF